MKMVKSLLLGSAAGIVALSGAQAADLPVKAKPAQYVKICSLYGAGFYYIPGTDTCIKVGGWVRQEIGYGYNGSFTTQWRHSNNNATTNNLNFRTKGTLTVDARDQTEYGTLRTYMALGTSNNITTGNVGNAGNYFNRWFIQFAGFTFGHAVSAFDGWYIAAKYAFGPLAGDTGDGGYDTLTYTAQLGNGFSASIAVEPSRRSGIINAGTASGTTIAPAAWAGGATNYGGQQVPDVVGNLHVDQAWGSAPVSAAWHQVYPTYYVGGNQASGSANWKSGWAVAAGATLKAPWFGATDEIAFGGAYSKGASAYVDAGPWAQGAQWKFNGPAGPGGALGFGFFSDAVMGGALLAGTATGLELTEAATVGVGFKHAWVGTALTSKVNFQYVWVKYNGLANAMLCTAAGLGTTGVGGTAAVAAAGCDNDYAYWAVSHQLGWQVTPNFFAGLEVVYAALDSASVPGGNAIAVGGAGTGRAVAQSYTIEDQDQWQLRFRVQRNFYP